MRGLMGGTFFLAVLYTSEACATCFNYCRKDRDPACEWVCSDSKIIKEGGTFSIEFNGLGSEAISGIPEFLKMGKAVQNSASSLTIKGLSKLGLDSALTKLKADKSNINIPQ